MAHKIFPLMNIEQEFVCPGEILSKLDLIDQFCSERLTPEQMLAATSNRKYALQELLWLSRKVRDAGIDPFDTSNQYVRIALIAGMISEGYGIEEIARPGVYSTNVSTWVSMNTGFLQLGWVNLAFRDRQSPIARNTRHAMARYCIKNTESIRLQSGGRRHSILEPLTHCLMATVINDGRPGSAPYLEDHLSEAVAVLCGVESLDRASPQDYDLESVTKACEYIAKHGYSKDMDARTLVDQFLSRFIPLFIDTWLDRDVEPGKVIAGAKLRIAAVTSVAGYLPTDSLILERLTIAKALFAIQDLFSRYVNDPYDALGADSDLRPDSVVPTIYGVAKGMILLRECYGDDCQVAAQLKRLGVDLNNKRAVNRLGWQAVTLTMLAGQGIEVRAIEDLYYPSLGTGKFPSWIYDDKHFNPYLSPEFLSEAVYLIANSTEPLVSIGGFLVDRTNVLYALVDVEDRVFNSLVLTLDAAGGLTQKLVDILDVDADLLGKLNLAALSRMGRGYLVSRSLGL